MSALRQRRHLVAALILGASLATSAGVSREAQAQHYGGGYRDHGGRDFGGRDFGGRDFGGRDFGGRDFGGRDYGRRDFGRFDGGPRFYGGGYLYPAPLYPAPPVYYAPAPVYYPPPPPLPIVAPPPTAYAPTPAAERKAFIVYFDWDQEVITPEARAVIRQAAEYYRSCAPIRIEIVGHADRSGAAGYNYRLSQRRASRVADLLSGEGVPRAAIELAARGEEDNRVPTGQGVREPQNRGVTVSFVEPATPAPNYAPPQNYAPDEQYRGY